MWSARASTRRMPRPYALIENVVGGTLTDVLLWDDTGSLALDHAIADSAGATDADVLIATRPKMAAEDDLYLDGQLVTAAGYDSRPVYFDGKLLTARDLTSEQTYFEVDAENGTQVRYGDLAVEVVLETGVMVLDAWRDE